MVRKREIRAEAYGGKNGIYREGRQVPSRRGKACKENLSRRIRRKQEQVSGCKRFSKESAEFWFYSKSSKPELGMEVGIRRAR